MNCKEIFLPFDFCLVDNWRVATRRKMATYLCVFHLATAGLNGALLGTDEEEVVLICFALVNATTNQVITSSFLHFKLLS